MKYDSFEEVIKAYPWELAEFLDSIATHKGKYSWLIVPQNSKNKVCLVAHIDTVFEDRFRDYPKTIKKEKYVLEGENVTLNTWSSPQGIGGDDRCGVYALLKIYNTLPEENKPYLLFTDGEESGGIGAYEATKLFNDVLTDVTFFVELDRQGFDDMVFYNGEPTEFIDYIGQYGFKHQIGSFSDITILGKHFKRCAVNLSIGYYGQHSVEESIVLEDLTETMNKVYNLCVSETNKTKVWEHEKKVIEYVGYVGEWGGYNLEQPIHQDTQTLKGFTWDY